MIQSTGVNSDFCGRIKMEVNGKVIHDNAYNSEVNRDRLISMYKQKFKSSKKQWYLIISPQNQPMSYTPEFRNDVYFFYQNETANKTAEKFGLTESSVRSIVQRYMVVNGLPRRNRKEIFEQREKRGGRPLGYVAEPKSAQHATNSHGNPAIFKKEKQTRIPPPFNPETHLRVWQPERRLWVEKRRDIL